ncbi:hypothetical protein [Alteromonas sp. ASW11-130]|uniref:hypothetical protein n=1 Tax=Alteromonas sp. ASW11-130 TaxID=3015775 RepID=UPI002241ABBC|nr:hypothetical protein [Alteromonas sp. ASW11-130]MCW8092255.1 hypothetical protein [Alteromonas sp. ASW11-130]
MFKVLESTEYHVVTGAPALMIFCLIFLEYLVELDEELAGGCSNPNDSKNIALLLVRELALKFIALLLGLWVVLKFQGQSKLSFKSTLFLKYAHKWAATVTRWRLRYSRHRVTARY